MSDVQTRDGLYGFEFRGKGDGRRVPAEERKTHDITQLWQRSHEIINLAVKGFKQTEIADILNISPQTVSNTLNSELARIKTAELRHGSDEEVKKFTEKVRVLTNKALNVYHEIFDDESGECTLKDKKSVADTVALELSGLRAPTKIQSHNITTILTKEEIEEFKNRGRAAATDARIPIVESPKENL